MEAEKINLENFQHDLKILREHGFNPIGVSQMYCYDTFIFETTEEANRVYEEIERPKKILCANWYGKEEHKIAVKEYEEAFGSKIDILWI